jgi:transcriptional regulator with XRE-family HTH domain
MASSVGVSPRLVQMLFMLVSLPPGSSTGRMVRADLGAFVRSRRERIDPVSVGLPGGGRRRTPGLRREEAALLAGVSVTWYTWLEQGRDITVSRQVLNGVSRALRLDDAERAYVFELAGLVAPAEAVTRPEPDLLLQKLVLTLDPHPAYLVTQWWDLVAYNRAYSALAGGLDQVPASERNVLWLMLTDPRMKRLFTRWDEEADRLVGQFRTQLAHRAEDPRGWQLEQALRQSAPEFTRLWNRATVSRFHSARKRLRHPTVGPLELDSVKLQSAADGQQVIVFLPADQRSEDGVRLLAEGDAPVP